MSTSVSQNLKHPLDLLQADEVAAVKHILSEAGLLSDTTYFASVILDMPKSEVLDFREGDPIDRKIRATLLERSTGQGISCRVSLSQSRILDIHRVDASVTGQVSILDCEFAEIEAIMSACPEWIQQLEKRGINPTHVRTLPLSAGYFGDETEIGQRIMRVLAFLQEDADALIWAHPIDGLSAYVDITHKKVLQIKDIFYADIPRETGRWDQAPHMLPSRTDLKPIEIIQPEGPSFVIEGNHISWANWSLRFGFDVREGLSLYQISFQDKERLRSIIYRASVAEMVVPYGDPSPVRYWQNYFDQGDYLFGRYTNSLELGCDCLGEIYYSDVIFADEFGNPQIVKNAICIHEEDDGVLWKHSDLFNGMQETRRSRKLVISNFITIGNYDYGFYWYFYLDGTIELEVKATGVVFTAAYTGPDGYNTEIAPGLGAPFHQHIFAARLDMQLDGNQNTISEIDVVRIPPGPDNPYGNAFNRKKTVLANESEAQRDANAAVGRVWQITNRQKYNRLGYEVGYTLIPQQQPTLLADPSSSIAARAAFATKNLWVTQYHDEEKYPSGEYVNQSFGGDGLPTFVHSDRNLVDEDIVIWHCFGLTHFPRIEDWPVMPVDKIGFSLKPSGFFDQNPTLDIPSRSSQASHCCGSEIFEAQEFCKRKDL